MVEYILNATMRQNWACNVFHGREVLKVLFTFKRSEIYVFVKKNEFVCKMSDYNRLQNVYFIYAIKLPKIKTPNIQWNVLNILIVSKLCQCLCDMIIGQFFFLYISLIFKITKTFMNGNVSCGCIECVFTNGMKVSESRLVWCVRAHVHTLFFLSFVRNS